MPIRRTVAVINLFLLGAALVAEHYLPTYATEIFYGLLFWMFASLVLFFGRPEVRPPAAPAGAPLDTGVAPASRSIDFCVYCATPLAASATICPVCGKAARPI